MTQKASKKIEIILKNILEEYTLLGPDSVFELNLKSDVIAHGIDEYRHGIAEERIIELDRILLILEGLVAKDILSKIELKLRNHHSELTITDEYAISFPSDFNERAQNYLKSLRGENNFESKKQKQKVKLEPDPANGLFLVDTKGKRIRIADDIASKQAKLIQYLSDPFLGVLKTIPSIIEALKSTNNDSRNEPVNSEKSIRNIFTEIQRILKTEKTSIKLGLKKDGNSFKIIIKD